MTQPQMEARMQLLERQLAELRAEVEKLKEPKDWRSTIGMFAGDEVMKQIDEEGRKIREKDREQGRRAAERAGRRARK